MSYLLSYQDIINQIDDIDPLAYAKTRNHLSGSVTRLSPYISRGVITLPDIRDRLYSRHRPADCLKLVQELAWREYFQAVWWHKEEAIFSDLRFPRQDWAHHDLVSVIVDASTGIKVIDEAIKELYLDGYMHNHARLWIAALACNLAKAHWLTMGKWLYYHLIDGDLASNFLSWQWVAGTSVNKQYTVNQQLINVWSDTKQSNTWLSVERDDLLTMTPPQQFLISEGFGYETSYPDTTHLPSVSGATVYLYTPWTLNPKWRAESQPGVRRILVIDPTWFDRFPVSETVLDFIIRQGQTVITDLEVFVGEYEDLPGLARAAEVFALRHQTNQTWPAIFDDTLKLFPAVTGYYPSFFKYWEAVTKHYGSNVSKFD